MLQCHTSGPNRPFSKEAICYNVRPVALTDHSARRPFVTMSDQWPCLCTLLQGQTSDPGIGVLHEPYFVVYLLQRQTSGPGGLQCVT